ncbi:site-specific integrase [Defluviitalea saccharophila]|uniref:Site-specific integrase n=1 Tax=Defluviitalea saccharophila TaxID=879970 RepID=A0ABZ2Y0U8_9FIRM
MVVEPIRDKKQIQKMKIYLLGRSDRDYLLFTVGINVGLRVSDLLRLQYKDIFTDNESFRQHLVIREQKTGKVKKIRLNDTVKKAIKDYVRIHELSGEDYLFESKKGGYITRVQAYKILREAAEAIGIEQFGTHSMRKTWGYHSYLTSKHNIGLIMDMFSHSSEQICLRYIGINQEQKDELYSMVQL